MADGHDVSVVSDDGVGIQPALDETKSATTTEVALDPFAGGLVEEQPVGASAAVFGAEAFEQVDDEGRDRSLLQAD